GGRLHAVGAGLDRVAREHRGLSRRVRGATDDDRDPSCDRVDRVLGDLHALLRRLGEPLAGRPVDQDAVETLGDIPLEQLGVRIGVVPLVRAERGRARWPVAGPGDVVSIHRSPFRSGAYALGRGSSRTMWAASILAVSGPRVKPVGARQKWKPGTARA